MRSTAEVWLGRDRWMVMHTDDINCIVVAQQCSTPGLANTRIGQDLQVSDIEHDHQHARRMRPTCVRHQTRPADASDAHPTFTHGPVLQPPYASDKVCIQPGSNTQHDGRTQHIGHIQHVGRSWHVGRSQHGADRSGSRMA